MKKAVFSAPGSVVISGEYTLNFGKPLLAFAIEPEIHTTVESSKTEINHSAEIMEAVAIVREHIEVNRIEHEYEPFDISCASQLPKSEIFGFRSAFYSTVIASLLYWYTEHEYDADVISLLSYKLDKRLNKKTYGIRTSLSSYGGLFYFRKEFEFLRTLSLLNIKFSEEMSGAFSLLSIGASESTKTGDFENIVGKRYNKNTVSTKRWLNESERETKRMVISIMKEDSMLFKQCMINEFRIAFNLGLISDTVKSLLEKVQDSGGAVILDNTHILVYSENHEKLMDIAKTYKAEIIRIRPAYSGCKKYEKNNTA